MEKSVFYEWYKWFKQDSENMEEVERNGLPRHRSADENVQKERNLVHLDRSLIIRNTAVQLNLDK
jgi:hypothetical protein